MAAGQEQPMWWLAFNAVGVWISFMVYGWALEHVTKETYISEGADGKRVEEKFVFETCIVIMTAFSNALLAFCILKAKGEQSLTAGAPAKEWIFAAFAYFGSHMMNYMSLRYIIYPLQVLVKSCKAIPVMFGEVIFESHVKLTPAKVVSVLMLTLGLIVFSVAQKSKKKEGEEVKLDTKMLFGLLIVLLALVCDGIYGPYQNKIKTRAEANGFKVSGFHNMFNMNLYQGSFALAYALVTGELFSVMGFFQRHPDVLVKLIWVGIAMCFGQIFIFMTQASFGALVVTKITTVRKLITVLFSVWYFGHSIQPLQWVGIAMVFVSEPVGKQIGKMMGGSAVAASSHGGAGSSAQGGNIEVPLKSRA